MKDITDSAYLLGRQYRDASNLQARVTLHQHFSTNPQGLIPWFAQRLVVPPGGQVLEVGAGPGGYWPEMPAIDPSWQITVTDFSPGMLARARERLSALNHPITVLPADAQNLPFPDASFDTVIANFMLYHVPDRGRALREIYRVLRPGGHLFAMTNGNRHLQEINTLVESIAPGAVRLAESGFSLENGAAQLSPPFARVRVELYPDALRVTDAAPLLAYIQSYVTGLAPAQERALADAIDAEIAAHGAFFITKDPGLFIADRV